jgi:hypothetical protein
MYAYILWWYALFYYAVFFTPLFLPKSFIDRIKCNEVVIEFCWNLSTQFILNKYYINIIRLIIILFMFVVGDAQWCLFNFALFSFHFSIIDQLCDCVFFFFFSQLHDNMAVPRCMSCLLEFPLKWWANVTDLTHSYVNLQT